MAKKIIYLVPLQTAMIEDTFIKILKSQSIKLKIIDWIDRYSLFILSLYLILRVMFIISLFSLFQTLSINDQFKWKIKENVCTSNCLK